MSLAPVQHRWAWVTGGLAFEGAGTAIPIITGYERTVHEGVGGHITTATVRLIWHQMIHNHHDLVLIILGVVLFVIGAVLLARPFCHSKRLLLVGIPIAALAGVAVLGAVALLICLVFAAGDWLDPGGLFDGIGGGGGDSSRKKRRQQQPEDDVRTL